MRQRGEVLSKDWLETSRELPERFMVLEVINTHGFARLL
jgi:hypothetical protein